MKNRNVSGLRAVVCGGLIAGTLDIFMASWISWLSPVVIMQAIASGLLGSASFQGGATSAALGFVLQWVMSLIIAAVYVIAAHWIRPLIRFWVAAGIAYGVVIFFVMNYVVVPLSAAPFAGPHFTPRSFALNMLAMLVFGVIVAGFARVFLGRRGAAVPAQPAASSKAV